MIRLFTLVCMLTLTLMNLPASAQTLIPDTIIVNATVRTMDPARPTAEAIAILGNRIVAVGSTTEIRKLAGASTRTIDAQKRLALPGFNDAHTHFLSGGFQLSSVDLRDANTPQEFASRIVRLPKNRRRVVGSQAAIGTTSVGPRQCCRGRS